MSFVPHCLCPWRCLSQCPPGPRILPFPLSPHSSCDWGMSSAACPWGHAAWDLPGPPGRDIPLRGDLFEGVRWAHGHPEFPFDQGIWKRPAKPSLPSTPPQLFNPWPCPHVLSIPQTCLKVPLSLCPTCTHHPIYILHILPTPFPCLHVLPTPLPCPPCPHHYSHIPVSPSPVAMPPHSSVSVSPHAIAKCPCSQQSHPIDSYVPCNSITP